MTDWMNYGLLSFVPYPARFINVIPYHLESISNMYSITWIMDLLSYNMKYNLKNKYELINYIIPTSITNGNISFNIMVILISILFSDDYSKCATWPTSIIRFVQFQCIIRDRFCVQQQTTIAHNTMHNSTLK